MSVDNRLIDELKKISFVFGCIDDDSDEKKVIDMAIGGIEYLQSELSTLRAELSNKIEKELSLFAKLITIESERKELQAELDKLKEQEPVAEVFKNSQTGTGLDYSFLGEVPEGTTKLYAHPVPPQQVPAMSVIAEIIEYAHMQGQVYAGVDPSYSAAKYYAKNVMPSPTPPSDEAQS